MEASDPMLDTVVRETRMDDSAVARLSGLQLCRHTTHTAKNIKRACDCLVAEAEQQQNCRRRRRTDPVPSAAATPRATAMTFQPEFSDMPGHTKRSVCEVNVSLWVNVAMWLRKRGKLVKPKLSAEQLKQLHECFSLMDQDGSGAIDVDELCAAFKLLGIKMKQAEIQQLLDEVDKDGTGELEIDEFLSIMTTTMQRVQEEQAAKANNQVPFGLVATAYRRKRLLEGIMANDKDVHHMINQMNEKAAQEEMMAQLRASEVHSPANSKTNPDAKLSAAMFGRDRIHALNELKIDEASIAKLPKAEQRVIMRLLNAKADRSFAATPSGTACSGTSRYKSSCGAPLERRRAGSKPSSCRTDTTGVPQRHLSSTGSVIGGPQQPGLTGHFSSSANHKVLMETPQLFDLKFNRPMSKLSTRGSGTPRQGSPSPGRGRDHLQNTHGRGGAKQAAMVSGLSQPWCQG